MATSCSINYKDRTYTIDEFKALLSTTADPRVAFVLKERELYKKASEQLEDLKSVTDVAKKNIAVGEVEKLYKAEVTKYESFRDRLVATFPVEAVMDATALKAAQTTISDMLSVTYDDVVTATEPLKITSAQQTALDLITRIRADIDRINKDRETRKQAVSSAIQEATDTLNNILATPVISLQEAELVPGIPEIVTQEEGPAEQEPAATTPPNVHVVVEDMDKDIEAKEFADISEGLTEERHLDDMTPSELEKTAAYTVEAVPQEEVPQVDLVEAVLEEEPTPATPVAENVITTGEVSAAPVTITLIEEGRQATVETATETVTVTDPLPGQAEITPAEDEDNKKAVEIMSAAAAEQLEQVDKIVEQANPIEVVLDNGLTVAPELAEDPDKITTEDAQKTVDENIDNVIKTAVEETVTEAEVKEVAAEEGITEEEVKPIIGKEIKNALRGKKPLREYGKKLRSIIARILKWLLGLGAVYLLLNTTAINTPSTGRNLNITNIQGEAVTFNQSTFSKTPLEWCMEFVNNQVKSEVSKDVIDELNMWGMAWTGTGKMVNAGMGEYIYQAIPEDRPQLLSPDAVEKYVKDEIKKNPIPFGTRFRAGDIVHFYYEGSDFLYEAYNKGVHVFTTHVGIVKVAPDGKLVIEHNIHGVIHHDKLSDARNGTIKSQAGRTILVSAIARPDYKKAIDKVRAKQSIKATPSIQKAPTEKPAVPMQSGMGGLLGLSLILTKLRDLLKRRQARQEVTDEEIEDAKTLVNNLQAELDITEGEYIDTVKPLEDRLKILQDIADGKTKVTREATLGIAEQTRTDLPAELTKEFTDYQVGLRNEFSRVMMLVMIDARKGTINETTKTDLLNRLQDMYKKALAIAVTKIDLQKASTPDIIRYHEGKIQELTNTINVFAEQNAVEPIASFEVEIENMKTELETHRIAISPDDIRTKLGTQQGIYFTASANYDIHYKGNSAPEAIRPTPVIPDLMQEALTPIPTMGGAEVSPATPGESAIDKEIKAIEDNYDALIKAKAVGANLNFTSDKVLYAMAANIVGKAVLDEAATLTNLALSSTEKDPKKREWGINKYLYGILERIRTAPNSQQKSDYYKELRNRRNTLTKFMLDNKRRYQGDDSNPETLGYITQDDSYNDYARAALSSYPLLMDFLFNADAEKYNIIKRFRVFGDPYELLQELLKGKANGTLKDGVRMAEGEENDELSTTVDNAINFAKALLDSLTADSTLKLLDSKTSLTDIYAVLKTEIKELNAINEPVPSNRQMISILEIIAAQHSKETKPTVAFENTTFLNGRIGSGKTSIVLKVALESLMRLSGNNVTNGTLLAGDTRIVGQNLENAMDVEQSKGAGFSAEDIRQMLINDKLPPNVELIVIDEAVRAVSKLKDTSDYNAENKLVVTPGIARLLADYNNRHETTIRLIIAGDTGQVMENAADVESITTMSPKLNMVTSLATSFRSKISSINSLQAIFENAGRNNTQLEVIKTSASIGNPWQNVVAGEIYGVSGSLPASSPEQKEKNLIETLKNRKGVKNKKGELLTKVLIVNKNNVEEWQRKIADIDPDGEITVLSYIDAQGQTFDEVYMNFYKDVTETDRQLSNDFLYNRALYTSARGRNFIYVASHHIESITDSTLAQHVQRANENLTEFATNMESGVISTFEHLNSITETKIVAPDKPAKVAKGGRPSDEEKEEELEDDTLGDGVEDEEEGEEGDETFNPDGNPIDADLIQQSQQRSEETEGKIVTLQQTTDTVTDVITAPDGTQSATDTDGRYVKLMYLGSPEGASLHEYNGMFLQIEGENQYEPLTEEEQKEQDRTGIVKPQKPVYSTPQVDEEVFIVPETTAGIKDRFRYGIYRIANEGYYQRLGVMSNKQLAQYRQFSPKFADFDNDLQNTKTADLPAKLWHFTPVQLKNMDLLFPHKNLVQATVYTSPKSLDAILPFMRPVISQLQEMTIKYNPKTEAPKPLHDPLTPASDGKLKTAYRGMLEGYYNAMFINQDNELVDNAPPTFEAFLADTKLSIEVMNGYMLDRYTETGLDANGVRKLLAKGKGDPFFKHNRPLTAGNAYLKIVYSTNKPIFIEMEPAVLSNDPNKTLHTNMYIHPMREFMDQVNNLSAKLTDFITSPTGMNMSPEHFKTFWEECTRYEKPSVKVYFYRDDPKAFDTSSYLFNEIAIQLLNFDFDKKAFLQKSYGAKAEGKGAGVGALNDKDSLREMATFIDNLLKKMQKTGKDYEFSKYARELRLTQKMFKGIPDKKTKKPKILTYSTGQKAEVVSLYNLTSKDADDPSYRRAQIAYQNIAQANPQILLPGQTRKRILSNFHRREHKRKKDFIEKIRVGKDLLKRHYSRFGGQVIAGEQKKDVGLYTYAFQFFIDNNMRPVHMEPYQFKEHFAFLLKQDEKQMGMEGSYKNFDEMYDRVLESNKMAIRDFKKAVSHILSNYDFAELSIPEMEQMFGPAAFDVDGKSLRGLKINVPLHLNNRAPQTKAQPKSKLQKKAESKQKRINKSYDDLTDHELVDQMLESRMQKTVGTAIQLKFVNDVIKTTGTEKEDVKKQPPYAEVKPVVEEQEIVTAVKVEKISEARKRAAEELADDMLTRKDIVDRRWSDPIPAEMTDEKKINNFRVQTTQNFIELAKLYSEITKGPYNRGYPKDIADKFMTLTKVKLSKDLAKAIFAAYTDSKDVEANTQARNENDDNLEKGSSVITAPVTGTDIQHKDTEEDSNRKEIGGTGTDTPTNTELPFFDKPITEADLKNTKTGKAKLRYLRRFVPKATPEKLHFLNRLQMLRVAGKEAIGKDIWGTFKDGAFYFTKKLGDDSVPARVIKHEAFHGIFRWFIKAKYRAQILDVATAFYGLDGMTNRDKEEYLADEFDSREDKGFLPTLIAWLFNWLRDIFGMIDSQEAFIEDYFLKIEMGYFRTPSDESVKGAAFKVDMSTYGGDYDLYEQAWKMVAANYNTTRAFGNNIPIPVKDASGTQTSVSILTGLTDSEIVDKMHINFQTKLKALNDKLAGGPLTPPEQAEYDVLTILSDKKNFQDMMEESLPVYLYHKPKEETATAEKETFIQNIEEVEDDPGSDQDEIKKQRDLEAEERMQNLMGHIKGFHETKPSDSLTENVKSIIKMLMLPNGDLIHVNAAYSILFNKVGPLPFYTNTLDPTKTQISQSRDNVDHIMSMIRSYVADTINFRPFDIEFPGTYSDIIPADVQDSLKYISEKWKQFKDVDKDIKKLMRPDVYNRFVDAFRDVKNFYRRLIQPDPDPDKNIADPNPIMKKLYISTYNRLHNIWLIMDKADADGKRGVWMKKEYLYEIERILNNTMPEAFVSIKHRSSNDSVYSLYQMFKSLINEAYQPGYMRPTELATLLNNPYKDPKTKKEMISADEVQRRVFRQFNKRIYFEKEGTLIYKDATIINSNVHTTTNNKWMNAEGGALASVAAMYGEGVFDADDFNGYFNHSKAIHEFGDMMSVVSSTFAVQPFKYINRPGSSETDYMMKIYNQPITMKQEVDAAHRMLSAKLRYSLFSDPRKEGRPAKERKLREGFLAEPRKIAARGTFKEANRTFTENKKLIMDFFDELNVDTEEFVFNEDNTRDTAEAIWNILQRLNVIYETKKTDTIDHSVITSDIKGYMNRIAKLMIAHEADLHASTYMSGERKPHNGLFKLATSTSIIRIAITGTPANGSPLALFILDRYPHLINPATHTVDTGHDHKKSHVFYHKGKPLVLPYHLWNPLNPFGHNNAISNITSHNLYDSTVNKNFKGDETAVTYRKESRTQTIARLLVSNFLLPFDQPNLYSTEFGTSIHQPLHVLSDNDDTEGAEIVMIPENQFDTMYGQILLQTISRGLPEYTAEDGSHPFQIDKYNPYKSPFMGIMGTTEMENTTAGIFTDKEIQKLREDFMDTYQEKIGTYQLDKVFKEFIKRADVKKMVKRLREAAEHEARILVNEMKRLSSETVKYKKNPRGGLVTPNYTPEGITLPDSKQLHRIYNKMMSNLNDYGVGIDTATISRLSNKKVSVIKDELGNKTVHIDPDYYNPNVFNYRVDFDVLMPLVYVLANNFIINSVNLNELIGITAAMFEDPEVMTKRMAIPAAKGESPHNIGGAYPLPENRFRIAVVDDINEYRDLNLSDIGHDFKEDARIFAKLPRKMDDDLAEEIIAALEVLPKLTGQQNKHLLDAKKHILSTAKRGKYLQSLKDKASQPVVRSKVTINDAAGLMSERGRQALVAVSGEGAKILEVNKPVIHGFDLYGVSRAGKLAVETITDMIAATFPGMLQLRIDMDFGSLRGKTEGLNTWWQGAKYPKVPQNMKSVLYHAMGLRAAGGKFVYEEKTYETIAALDEALQDSGATFTDRTRYLYHLMNESRNNIRQNETIKDMKYNEYVKYLQKAQKKGTDPFDIKTIEQYLDDFADEYVGLKADKYGRYYVPDNLVSMTVIPKDLYEEAKLLETARVMDLHANNFRMGVAGFPKERLIRLDEIYTDPDNRPVQLAAPPSALKFGAPAARTTWDPVEEKWGKMPHKEGTFTIHLSDVSLQVKPTDTAKGMTVPLPTQANAFANINDNNLAEIIDLQNALAEIMRLQGQILDEVGQIELIVANRFDTVQWRKNMTAIAQIYEYKAGKNATKMEHAKLLKEQTSMTSEPSFINDVQMTMSSAVDNGMHRHRFDGMKLTQVSPASRENVGIGPLPRYDEEEMVAEVYLPDVWSKKIIKAFKLKTGQELTPEEVLQRIPVMLGYRIPSTGFNSIVRIKVIGFYPSKEGINAVIGPSDMTYIMGSDFDADALFVMMSQFPSARMGPIASKVHAEIYEGNEKLASMPVGYDIVKHKESGLFEVAPVEGFMERIAGMYEAARLSGRDATETAFIRQAYITALRNKYFSTYTQLMLKKANKADARYPISFRPVKGIDLETSDFNQRAFALSPEFRTKWYQAYESGDLFVDLDKQGELEKERDLLLYETKYLNSIVGHVDVKMDATGGSNLTGPFANSMTLEGNIKMASKDFATNKKNKIILGKALSYKYNGENIKELVYVTKDGKAIFLRYQLMTNAAIDMIKEQILPILNVTEATLNAYNGLRRGPLSDASVSTILNQPVIRSYTKNYSRFNTRDAFTMVKKLYVFKNTRTPWNADKILVNLIPFQKARIIRDVARKQKKFSATANQYADEVYSGFEEAKEPEQNRLLLNAIEKMNKEEIKELMHETASIHFDMMSSEERREWIDINRKPVLTEEAAKELAERKAGEKGKKVKQPELELNDESSRKWEYYRSIEDAADRLPANQTDDFVAYQLSIVKLFQKAHNIGKNLFYMQNVIGINKKITVQPYDQQEWLMKNFAKMYKINKSRFFNKRNNKTYNLAIGSIERDDQQRPVLKPSFPIKGVDFYNIPTFQQTLDRFELLIKQLESTAVTRMPFMQIMATIAARDLGIAPKERDFYKDMHKIVNSINNLLCCSVKFNDPDGNEVDMNTRNIEPYTPIYRRKQLTGMNAYIAETYDMFIQNNRSPKYPKNAILNNLKAQDTDRRGIPYFTFKPMAHLTANEEGRFAYAFKALPMDMQVRLFKYAMYKDKMSHGATKYSKYVNPEIRKAHNERYTNMLIAIMEEMGINSRFVMESVPDETDPDDITIDLTEPVESYEEGINVLESENIEKWSDYFSLKIAQMEPDMVQTMRGDKLKGFTQELADQREEANKLIADLKKPINELVIENEPTEQEDLDNEGDGVTDPGEINNVEVSEDDNYSTAFYTTRYSHDTQNNVYYHIWASTKVSEKDDLDRIFPMLIQRPAGWDMANNIMLIRVHMTPIINGQVKAYYCRLGNVSNASDVSLNEDPLNYGYHVSEMFRPDVPRFYTTPVDNIISVPETFSAQTRYVQLTSEYDYLQERAQIWEVINGPVKKLDEKELDEVNTQLSALARAEKTKSDEQFDKEFNELLRKREGFYAQYKLRLILPDVYGVENIKRSYPDSKSLTPIFQDRESIVSGGGIQYADIVEAGAGDLIRRADIVTGEEIKVIVDGNKKGKINPC